MNDGSFRKGGEIPPGAHGVLLGTSVTDQKREKFGKRPPGEFEGSQAAVCIQLNIWIGVCLQKVAGIPSPSFLEKNAEPG
jgi:hypothetical protein